MNIEFELKLDLDAPEDVNVLLRALELGPSEPTQMHAIYFDTPDTRLARHGYALRIRQEGKRRIQTVKKSASPGSGPFARREWEQPVASNVPSLPADNPISELLGARTADLEPHFEVQTSRSVWEIDTGEGVIEMALDRGEARAGAKTAPFTEIELELKAGDEAAVFALARRINRLTPVRLGVLTKVERAQRLLKHRGRSDKSEPVPLTSEMTAADAFRVIAHACIRHYRLNEARLLHEDNTAALHQARVALRRLRSALTVFRPIAKDRRAKQLNADLRWLTRQLGQARNIDVLIPRIKNTYAQARLKAARSSAYAEARRAMASNLTREMMIDLAEWLSIGKWTRRKRTRQLRDEVPRDYAARAIDRLHNRLVGEAGAITGSDDHERHETRKRAKKLRYTVEFFASLHDRGKERKARIRYLAAIEELQDALGILNDMVVMPDMLKKLGLKPEQIENMAEDAGTRDLHMLHASDAMASLCAAKHFWE